MIIYVLDESFGDIGVVDKYKSFLWVDRFTSSGDFQLVINKTSKNADLLVEGRHISIDAPFALGTDDYATRTRKVMKITTVQETNSREEKGVLTISGESLLGMFADRAIGTSLTPAGADYDTENTDMLEVVYTLIEKAIGNGALNLDAVLRAADTIPNTIIIRPTAWVTTTDDIQVAPGTLYERSTELCEKYSIGIDVGWVHFPWWADDAYQIVINLYLGKDRSSDQTDRDAVIFSQELGTLTNTKELRSIAGRKNVAYIYGKDVATTVTNETPEPTGWNRRVLIVNASDIAGTTTKAINKLKTRGRLELKKYKTVTAFDGEVPSNTKYKYGVDYFMGDIVEQQSSSGTKTKMRVTEFIRKMDGEGYSAYPTLTALDD